MKGKLPTLVGKNLVIFLAWVKSLACCQLPLNSYRGLYSKIVQCALCPKIEVMLLKVLLERKLLWLLMVLDLLQLRLFLLQNLTLCLDVCSHQTLNFIQTQGKNKVIHQKYIRGVFRTFELRVLTVIDCPKIVGAKGR